MLQLGFIMRGLAIVYQLQLVELESNHRMYNNLVIEDSKNLLSMLNGDYLWNNYLKKQ